MCGKGYKISFSDEGCEIWNIGTSKLIYEGRNIDSDVFISVRWMGKNVSIQTEESWL